jgi:hypothetical protein
MQEEIWLPCPYGYENYYEVSNLGRVKTKAVFIRHDGNFSEYGGYIKHLKVRNQQTNRYGYKTIKLCKLGTCKQYRVHRLVAKAFLPNENPNDQVNHIDGDKTNNTVINLEYVTCQENMKHAWETGLVNKDHTVGSRHHNALLNEQLVIEIRSLYAKGGYTQKELAEIYGVKFGTIKDVLTNRTWKHVL